LQTKNNEGVSSRVSAVYNAPPRHSFIVALKDVKEVWEIPYSATLAKGNVGVNLCKEQPPMLNSPKMVNMSY